MSVFIKQGSNCMLRSEYGRNLQYQAIMFLIQLEMTMAVERNQAINTVFGGFINKIRDLLSKLMTEILKRENLEQQYNVKTLSIDF